MTRFYAPDLMLESKQYLLSEEESKHCVRVLRKKKGDAILLVNGNGVWTEAIIADDHPKRCLLVFEKGIIESKTPTIHIAMAPTKNMDRVEWFLEKATELGLSKLTFLHCKNNERKQVPIERLNKIAVAAMKQSQRYYLPEITDLVSFDRFVAENPKSYIAHCEDDANKKTVFSNQENCLLIGPEGDFTPQEIELALQHNCVPVSLGDFRLRTETAALLGVVKLGSPQ